MMNQTMIFNRPSILDDNGELPKISGVMRDTSNTQMHDQMSLSPSLYQEIGEDMLNRARERNFAFKNQEEQRKFTN